MGDWGRTKAIIGKEAAISDTKQERANFGHFGGFTMIFFGGPCSDMIME